MRAMAYLSLRLGTEIDIAGALPQYSAERVVLPRQPLQSLPAKEQWLLSCREHDYMPSRSVCFYISSIANRHWVFFQFRPH
jgi:hypothetical protein